jgi:chromosome partitioning protein
MRVIAIANQKGGVAKTTTTVNLAAALGEAKQKTLVLDLDPQANASSWLGISDGGKGIFDTLVNNVHLSDIVKPSVAPNVDLVPASAWLASIEKALAGEVGTEMLLAKAINSLPKDRWAFLLIDCPPALGLLSISALVAAKEVLVPVETKVLPLAGLAQLSQTIERVKERLNADLVLSGVLGCRADNRTNLSKDVMEKLRGKFGEIVFTTVIRENVRLAEAPSFAKPITMYDPKGPGAKDYRAAAKELIKRGKQVKSWAANEDPLSDWTHWIRSFQHAPRKL